jgi:CDP-paratose 2-epimerase
MSKNDAGIALITGSAGLIGSQACSFFQEKGFRVIGIDNDLRAYFFGKEASTLDSKNKLVASLKNYSHYDIDIRSYFELQKVFSDYSSDIKIIIHTAAQPSHDWAAKEPLTDFSVNAVGTINLLECFRKYCPNATFIFTSTNKVYGDRPNYNYKIEELDTRFEAFNPDSSLASVNESLSIDSCKHSIFGASKVSADIMCQEYGKYFGLNVGVFRGGCLTGPNHASTELHGFLSYLVKCIVSEKHYKIFGYKGKQVRDNIHSWDLVNMFWSFHNNPGKGEVYNAGGGRANSISILEAIQKINTFTNSNWSDYEVLSDNRIGDHIWYITDLSKFQSDYPSWRMTTNIDDMLKQMILFEQKNL